MFNSKAALIILAGAAIVQLYVPAAMIIEREHVLTDGRIYKFKTAPVDPNDPFRGKYIELNYAANNFRMQQKNNWERNETVYVLISNSADGFAKIDTLLKEQPAGGDFIKAKVNYISFDSLLYVDYPFNKYYMEEGKAPAAEKVYTEYRRDTTHKTYALVSVKDGDAVLKDVMIDETPIREMIKNQRK